jgi:16S rRNA (cytidine1402-2'-O)-methyltransferase
LSVLALAYRDGAETRGEFVVVVGPPGKGGPTEAIDLDSMLTRALASASLKDAVAAVAAATGEKRRVVYQRALALLERGDDESR